MTTAKFLLTGLGAFDEWIEYLRALYVHGMTAVQGFLNFGVTCFAARRAVFIAEGFAWMSRTTCLLACFHASQFADVLMAEFL
jgi:hypothetical protein